MSVKKRELKTIEELQSWISGGADGTGKSEPLGSQPYVIVRQPPQCGAADWNAVSGVAAHDAPPHWTPHLRHSISRAKLLFDIR
jgi:hypothetical protein